MIVRFHPEAEKEYADAIHYYLAIHAQLAEGFVNEIEDSITAIRRDPLAWRIVDTDVRRYLVHRFPFGIYYTFDDVSVTVWSVMHLSRNPGYWKPRKS